MLVENQAIYDLLRTHTQAYIEQQRALRSEPDVQEVILADYSWRGARNKQGSNPQIEDPHISILKKEYNARYKQALPLVKRYDQNYEMIAKDAQQKLRCLLETVGISTTDTSKVFSTRNYQTTIFFAATADEERGVIRHFLERGFHFYDYTLYPGNFDARYWHHYEETPDWETPNCSTAIRTFGRSEIDNISSDAGFRIGKSKESEEVAINQSWLWTPLRTDIGIETFWKTVYSLTNAYVLDPNALYSESPNGVYPEGSKIKQIVAFLDKFTNIPKVDLPKAESFLQRRAQKSREQERAYRGW